MFASFASIARLPLAEATLLGYLSPSSQRLRVCSCFRNLQRSGVPVAILGTIGVVSLVWPELGQAATDDTRLIGFGFALLMGLLTALALIMVRSLSRTESPGSHSLLLRPSFHGWRDCHTSVRVDNAGR
ncbi:hypothetical protein [Peteryoungia algae]|uniref:hypothetical protein n=1 Tax=Peteryoungia algae TaxID=2919917 RepID=UPI00259FF495|nr:hypothetical protein [Rhizobium sp. SSM4.3]